MEQEIRAALTEADGADALSPEQFETLVGALIQKAKQSDIISRDVERSRVEASRTESGLYVVGPHEDQSAQNGNYTYQADIIGVVVLMLVVCLAVFIWRRMHHGGALGHNGNFTPTIS